MSNHIIIGLGGTGGKIIRAFRKTIFRDFKKPDPTGVNVNYLYVDSSDEMMGTEDPTWKILGENIQLKQKNQLKLEGGSLAARLDDIHNYSGLSRWIGDKSNWGNILNMGSGAKILGGQKRRLGRFLFACHVSQYCNQISELVRLMTEGETRAVTFHVCCGLAGGTGSGAVVDAIVQLRKLYPDPRSHRIILYVLLPDRHPKATWNTGNYFANGYAALMELNALSVGRFRPYDVSGRSERVENLTDPFQACYLVTNDNENGLTLDVDREVPEVMAMFLYQKIVVTTGVNWQQLGRAEAFENRDMRPEGLDPALGERSRLFIAFGLKQLSYPEEEITELLAFAFARQATLQLAYNHWTDADGFTDGLATQDPTALINDPQTPARWKLTDAHLCLEQGIFGTERSPEERNWKNLTTEWNSFIQRISGDTTSQTDRNWVSELITLCQDRFDHRFRDVGVTAYYDGKFRNRDDYAREIRSTIEDSLFTDWKDGRRSIRDVATVVQESLDWLCDRRSHVRERLAIAERQRDSALIKLQQNTTEWEDVGVLGRLLGKQKEVFDAASANAGVFYSSSSYRQAWYFAENLLNEVEAQLNDLKSRVDTAGGLLRGTIERFDRSMEERCVAGNDENFKKHIVRLYKADEVQSIVRKLIRDRSAQVLQTTRARQSVTGDLIGNQASFQKFSEVNAENLLDELEKVCLHSVTQAHGAMVEQAQGRIIRLLGVSMIDKLKERYESNPNSMRSEIENIVRMAGSFLPISEAERQKSGSAGTSTGNLIKMLTIMLPSAPDEKQFVDKLKNEFQSASKDCIPDFIETESRRHEVTIISLVHLFPLRFAELLGFLRDAYQDRLKGADADQARMLLHLEGDGQQHPALFVPTVMSLGLPLLLIGKATGIVVELQDDGAGLRDALVTAGKDGLPIRLILGRTYSDSLASLAGGNNLATLNNAVTAVLTAEEFRQADRRLETKEKIRNQVTASNQKSGSSDMYDNLIEAARTAIARIDSIPLN